LIESNETENIEKQAEEVKSSFHGETKQQTFFMLFFGLCES